MDIVELDSAPAGGEASSRVSGRWKYKFITVAVVAGLAVAEMKTAFVQSRILAAAAGQIRYSVGSGPSDSIRFPQSGPFNARVGYGRIPEFAHALEKSGFVISAQARPSEVSGLVSDLGLFPIYREKIQAGLKIVDRSGKPLFQALYPKRAYADFDSIPPIVVNTLLFIENREILSDGSPYVNPALEWDRLGKAVIDLGMRRLGSGAPVSGGSTLATQLEKIRHSPQGRTVGVGDKLRQMMSASLRAYQDGAETLDTRKRIVCDYINSVPMASLPGYGEVHGLGDGLWAWFDAEFPYMNQILSEVDRPGNLEQKARAYRQVLSLLLAIRKPSAYLQGDRAGLEERLNAFLPLLEEAGVITPELRRAAAKARIRYRNRIPPAQGVSFASRKISTTIRGTLVPMMGVDSVYDLDRLDLTVGTSVDAPASEAATAILKKLHDPEFVIASGLTGNRMLASAGAPNVIYSFTLYENVGGANYLRVQADNFEGPLNLNEGTRLELGSTAKLRTLVTYLEIVAELHARYANKPLLGEREKLRNPHDDLALWAIDYLTRSPDHSLTAMLEAAMLREYSGSPTPFFTGGGQHVFSNFEGADNHRILTVREALHRSVNLVFIRMMRDIVNHYMYAKPGQSEAILTDPENPMRRAYLERFGEDEAKQYLARFYSKYRGLSGDQAVEKLIEGLVSRTPKRMAVIFRSTYPEAGFDKFAEFVNTHASAHIAPSVLENMYESYGPDKFEWRDRGFLAQLHPLELWYLHYLTAHARPTFGKVLDDSIQDRKRVYEWLVNGKHHTAQNLRIHTMLEQEAFELVLASWKKQGYPFSTMVPSLASALGSSGDNPAALTELAGIIINDGMRYPSLRLEDFRFAQGTPMETSLSRTLPKGTRALAPEIAALLRLDLFDVVEKGTARRAFQSVVLSGGTVVPVGGKTGTGDNRMEIYGSRGVHIGSKVMNRTAAFVFIVGDRFFGTVTAYVPGPEAAHYNFTSALPVQVFKTLVPTFLPLLEGPAQVRTAKSAPAVTAGLSPPAAAH